MPTAVAPLARQVAERAQQDSGFAEVLDAILEAPTVPHGTLQRIAARSLNDERRGALVREFVEGSLPTPQVQARLGLKSPQAVHRLRSRGKLLGSAVGNQTWFPAWQFDDDRVRPDLPRILELLTQFTSDPLAADRIMRLRHDDLGGASIAARWNSSSARPIIARTSPAVRRGDSGTQPHRRSTCRRPGRSSRCSVPPPNRESVHSLLVPPQDFPSPGPPDTRAPDG